MKKESLIIGGVVAGLMLWGAYLTPQSSKTASADGSKDIAILQEQVGQMAQKIDMLQTRVQIQEGNWKMAQDKLQAIHNWTTATFDPTDSSFEPLEASAGVGSFAVAVKDVQQFGDGVRIKLNLGNLTAATFVGANLTLKYGPRMPEIGDPNWQADEAKWESSTREHSVDLTDTLRPASWNEVSVVLPQIEQRNFGYLEARINTSTISLGR